MRHREFDVCHITAIRLFGEFEISNGLDFAGVRVPGFKIVEFATQRDGRVNRISGRIGDVIKIAAFLLFMNIIQETDLSRRYSRFIESSQRVNKSARVSGVGLCRNAKRPLFALELNLSE